MPFAVTCTCGARLEIDDKFAGQKIACPDCRQPLPTSGAPLAARRTSGLALASLILALAGAFTIVGTALAVIAGALALAQIAKNPERFAGRRYAIAGIAIALPMTAVTLLALVFASSTLELFGIPAMMNGTNWTGKLDHGGPLEVVRTREGFAIKRPSEKWGVYRQLPSGLGFGDDHFWDDLLLVVPEEDMVVLCYAEPLPRDGNQGIEACRDKAVRDFNKTDRNGLFNKGGKDKLRSASMAVNETKRPVVKDRVQMVEMRIDKRMGGEDKSFLMRVYHREGDDDVFVVIGGVRRSQFGRLEGQIREAMDGFRILNRNDGPQP